MNLSSKYAHNTAPIVLPMAVAKVKNPTGVPCTKLKSQAPSATPHHMRYPKSRIAASAIPDGAQTSGTSPPIILLDSLPSNPPIT